MALEVLCVGVVVADAVGVGIDQWPQEGSLMLFDRVELHLGGCPANTAVALSKMGLRAGVAAKVGRDGLGEFVSGTLSGHGVDVRGLRATPQDSTSFSFIMVPQSGNRRIYHTLGANGTFGPADMDQKLFKGAKWVAFGGLSLMPKLAGANLAQLLRAARRAGARTAADTALNNRLLDWEPLFEGCWEHMDVFFPSEEEARRIAGDKSPREMCRLFRGRGVKIAGVKLGERGCVLESDDGFEEVPAYKVKCVDTLGAGDCFMAGLLAGLVKGLPPAEAARLGNATSAHCVQAVGSTTGIVPLPKILKFMRAHGG